MTVVNSHWEMWSEWAAEMHTSSLVHPISVGSGAQRSCKNVSPSVLMCSQPRAWGPSLHATAELRASAHALHPQV